MQLFSQINTVIPTSPLLISTEVIANSFKDAKLNSTNFLSFQELNTNKPYVPLTGCVLEHILYSTEIPTLAKLTYILGDSLALKNHHQNGRQRAVDLSAEDWALRLNCSKTEVFATQKKLEEKGYFVIKRSTNKEGRNQKNVITPTLPDQVFQALAKAPTRWNADITWHNDIPSSTMAAEYKRFCLDNTKLFFPLNFPLLKLIAANSHLSIFAKLVFIDFLASWHKYYTVVKNDINQQHNSAVHSNDQSFVISYKELATKFNCSLRIISRVIVELKKLGFIQKQRFFVSNDDSEDNRRDKSLWNITISLPPSLILELAKEPDRAKSSVGNTKKDEHYDYDKQCHLPSIHTVTYDAASIAINTKNSLLEPPSETVSPNSDPQIHQFGQYNNIEYILNIQNTDSLDSNVNFLKNSNNPEEIINNLSELSVSYKNIIFEKKEKLAKEEKNEQITASSTIETVKPQKSVTRQLADTTTVNNSATKIAESSKEVEKILVKQNTDQPQIIANSVVKDDIPDTENSNQEKIKITQPISQKTVKFSPGSRLKDWYPLLEKDVDRINSKSNREFSINFANELLLKLDNKYPGRVFSSKNHVISYMTKAFLYEKHQSPMVNHQTFRFVRDDQEYVAQRQREKYLSEVESSIDTSYESQLKRKIAALFEPKLAYLLLTKAKFEYHCGNSVTNDLHNEYNPEIEHKLDDYSSLELKSIGIEDISNVQDIEVLATQDLNTNVLLGQQNNFLDSSVTVKIPSCLKLTDQQQKTLENAITAVYGYVDITYQQISTTYNKQGNSQLRQTEEIYLEELDHTSAWYKIRKELKNDLGDFVDRAWFSKLTAQENLKTKTLTLLAPTNFIRDWIKNKYGHVIEKIARKLNYQVVELTTKKHVEFAA